MLMMKNRLAFPKKTFEEKFSQYVSRFTLFCLIWILFFLIGISVDFTLKGFPAYYFSLIPKSISEFILSRWGFLFFITGIISYLYISKNPLKIRLKDIIEFKSHSIYIKSREETIIVFRCTIPIINEFNYLKSFIEYKIPLKIEVDLNDLSYLFIFNFSKLENSELQIIKLSTELKSYFSSVKKLTKRDLMKYFLEGKLLYNRHNISVLERKKSIQDILSLIQNQRAVINQETEMIKRNKLLLCGLKKKI